MEATRSKENCVHCGIKMGPDWVSFHTKQGPVCMGCEGSFVDCYEVRLAGEENGASFVDRDVGAVVDLLSDLSSDEGGYVIRKVRIHTLKYHNLDEFQGF